MVTKKLFEEDVYLKSCQAVVTDIRTDEKGNFTVELDRTVFFPTGGGQSSDKGEINGFSVDNVREIDNRIWHSINDNSCNLKIGDKVSAAIDWDIRFDNMQRHCGEHILSGLFHRLYGGVNRGFHMGEDYITIDISLEDNSEFEKITWDMAKSLETLGNEAIYDNLPVSVKYFDTRDEAETMPLRKELAFDEDISIVTIGCLPDPIDCVACCGTHPDSTGQVGMIKIYKVEVNKGMYRIYFEAGKRAFVHYQQRFDVLTTLENRLSAGFEDLLDKYEAQQEKNKQTRNELYQLKKYMISEEVEKIKDEITPYYIKKYTSLSTDDLLAVGRELVPFAKAVFFLVHEPTGTVLLFSNGEKEYDCGALVKENVHVYNGKGGGNKNSARAILAKAEYIDTFIDLIIAVTGGKAT